MRFFTSDTHFNHENILVFSRPEFKNPDEMNWEIVRIWNSIVKPEDTIFHMGDLAFKTGLKRNETIAILQKLNGVKRLKLGNHENKKHMPHFEFAFEDISVEETITIRGVKFRMAHFPFPWGRTEKDLAERPFCMTEPKNDEAGNLIPLLCGHVHDSWAVRKGCMNVGWDIWKRPISEDEVMRVFEATKGFTVDLDKAIDL